MHTLNRTVIVVAGLLVLVPLGTATLLLGDVRGETREQLTEAMETAKDAYREGADAFMDAQQHELSAKQLFSKLQAMGREKRQLRLRMAALLREVGEKTSNADQLVVTQELAVRTFHRQREEAAALARLLHGRRQTAGSGPSAGWILRRLLGHSLGERMDAELRDAALARAREEILRRLLAAHETSELTRQQLHGAAGTIGDELVDLRGKHESLRKKYLSTLRLLEAAQRGLRVSKERLAEIQQIVAQVEADILAMQSELARIDGRLRSRAERELVQMGLREDRPDRFRKPGPAGKGTFTWPASGPVSAGFRDHRYAAIFGVAHKGIDIVVPQGSPVYAAADGIVYLVRLGGARGYTYVLIGHRDGTATLYGHLAGVMVAAGSHVGRGELIGRSGGAPGTEGAGPMTTGAHLHFEVIVRGQHVDPRSVLP